MCDKITINIYFLGGILKTACISSNSSIETLNTLYPNQSLSFIFHGRVLPMNGKLCDEDIRDGSLLIALSSKEIQNNKICQDWLNYTQYHKKVTHQILVFSNPKNTFEICRIRDLKMMNCLRSKKFMRTFKNYNDSMISLNNSSLNLNYDSLDEPATTPLPIFWN